MKHILNSLLVLSLLLAATHSQAQTWRHQSALSSGTWFKIGIASEGIYRLSASDLSALNGCDIHKIALYGQPGGMLNENNQGSRPDDLEEMAIELHDNNGNGTFDSDDYLLFYAQGPDEWQYRNSDLGFYHQSHHYSTLNYCYLTTSADQGKRISTSYLTANSDNTISGYTCRAFHENDLVNPEQSGRLWMGELFTTSTSQRSFDFSLPNRINTNIKVYLGLASLSSGNSRFNVSVGGSSYSIAVPSSYEEDVHFLDVPVYSDLSVTLNYHGSSNSDKGYLDYIVVNATSSLTFTGGQMDFRSTEFLNDSLIHNFSIAQATSSMRVWDVTDYHNVTQMGLTTNGSTATFASPTLSLHEFIAFDNSHFLTPSSVTSINHQNLHALEGIEYVIVAHPQFLTYANTIAEDHLGSGLSVEVVTDEQVYNEFSSGKQDPIAIRELMRMLYRRAKSDPSLSTPKYLMLFGKGTYDPKDIEGNHWPIVVTGESLNSFGDEGVSFATDDIFGFLDNSEGLLPDRGLDIGIGRVPARNNEEAELFVKKHQIYLNRDDLRQSNIRGDWRNFVTLLADDADPSKVGDTIFVTSCELAAQQIHDDYPFFNIEKIYSDSYHQQSGAIGSYYPDANNALKTRMDYGCILLNYVGHGSIEYIGTEKYMTKTDISGYKNHRQLPLFVTSTCSFGRYDKNNTVSGAEAFLFAEGGGIGIISAARPIQNYYQFNALLCNQSLHPSNSVGDAFRIAKNSYSVSHCITLFGDPALRLSIPENEVKVTAINNRQVQSNVNDTAVVLSSVTVEGEIVDPDGNRLTDFNGLLYVTVYDRQTRTSTLGNDNEGATTSFTQQKNVLYRGSDSVHNGTFAYQFIVPRDVAYAFDFGKLSHFAKSGITTAKGSYHNLLFGGFNDTVDLSVVRPEIRLFMNDSNFRSGGVTDDSPAIYALLYDKVGINSVGSGLGHDITAIIDDNYNEMLTLNDYYETDIEDNHKGSLKYYLNDLAPGLHTLTLKAWNIYNYSNSATITFLVKSPGQQTADDMCINIAPNPSVERTTIRVEHNMQDSIASAMFDIFDMCGKRVRTFSPTPADGSFVIGPVVWDFTTEQGTTVPNGVYLLRAVATTKGGSTIVKKGKIIHIAP